MKQRSPEVAPVAAAPPPVEAERVFGPQLPVAQRYAELLVGPGVERGLVGPRETGRIWERHLLNCAVVAAAVPAGSVVFDIGSGAGLPGVAIAIVRPDLEITLVEPLQRRFDFLVETAQVLSLPRVHVLRARAEDVDPAGADVVTARAVAPLARLAAWCLPLLRPGGALLALKGARAAQELGDAEPELRNLGASSWRIERMGLDVLEHPTTVVVVTAGDQAARAPRATGAGAAKGRR